VEHGGWECYLAAPEEGEDPAVFQSEHAKNPNGEDTNEEGVNSAESGTAKSSNGIEAGAGIELEIDPSQLSPSDFDSDSEGSGETDDDDSDGPLLTQPVSFNTLMIVCRDPGVMRFVKYLEAGAKGSRWDIGGEWEVGILEEDGDNDSEVNEEA
jgi:hypothetical protein